MRDYWRFSLLFVFLLAGCGKYEEREREVGYRGLAKINHFLAAERFAVAMGWEANQYAGLPSLPPPAGITVILPAESLQSEGQLEAITSWLDAGGHLIVFISLSGRDRYGNLNADDGDQPHLAFTEYFGFELVENDLSSEGEETTQEDGGDGEGEDEQDGLVTAVAFEEEEPYLVNFQSRYLLRDRDFPERGPRAFHAFEYGEGSLTVLTSAHWLTNERLAQAEHASLFWDVLQMEERQELWLIQSTRLSFGGLLWRHFPYAIVILLVTLVMLVWWAARGFGPRFVRGTNPSARLDQHLEASGAFFLRHQAEGVVITQLRAQLLRKIARATNQPLNLVPEELLIIAQERGVLSLEEKEALTVAPTKKSLLSTLTTLQHLTLRL